LVICKIFVDKIFKVNDIFIDKKFKVFHFKCF